MIIITKEGKLNAQLRTCWTMLDSAQTSAPEGEPVVIEGLKFWTGGRRKMRLADRSSSMKDFLNTFGIDYTEGNNAPRGGVAGYTLTIPAEQRPSLIKALEETK